MREQFENLPEIADSLSNNIVFIGDKYTTANDSFYDLVNWLNGAWYAYQEQQDKIKKIESIVDNTWDVDLMIQEIKEILK